MRSWSVLLAIAVLAGCGADDERPAAAPTPDFELTLPSGWHQAERSQTPGLVNPYEILSAGTAPQGVPGDVTCAHMPEAALERMGPRDAFVSIQERYGEAGFPARPARFSLPPPEHNDASECASNGDALDIHWFTFRDAERSFHVLAAFGRDAPPERREEALALLDSLRFAPGPVGVRLDPDRAARYQDAGLTWQMPEPPWRRYEWPMTSAHGERLLLGTFDLEPTPPDPNCTPRAAIKAMPPDGAFVYVFEYPDPPPEVPERTGELELGPVVAYECMGESRMVRWRDGGRAFQAHVYLGPEAGAALERDARSILNSIQVTR